MLINVLDYYILVIEFFSGMASNSDIVFTSYIVYVGFIFLVCKFEKEKKILKKKKESPLERIRKVFSFKFKFTKDKGPIHRLMLWQLNCQRIFITFS